MAQTALAVVLLIAGGLLLQSFGRLMAVDPGFSAESVLTASVTIRSVKYGKDPEVVGFYESLLRRIASLPGVAAVRAAAIAPLADGLIAKDIEVEGHRRSPTPRAHGLQLQGRRTPSESIHLKADSLTTQVAV